MFNARPNSPAPKGLAPKTPVGTSTQKREQTNGEDKKGSISPTSSKLAGPDKTMLEGKVEAAEQWIVEPSVEEEVEAERIDEIGDQAKESLSGGEVSSVVESNQGVENGSVGSVSEGEAVLQWKKTASENYTENVADGISSEGRHLSSVKNVTVSHKSIETDKKLIEEASAKLKLEAEANLRKEKISRLAKENFSRGNKLFVFPEVVRPDQDIEVFLNRSLSTLNNEPDVLMMGAFNDWRWKSFTMRLTKTHLIGDWWSCHLHVPKEAYKIDFVFFNGQSVYDNNDKKDFCISVEGGMDVFQFEDFLLEEKRKELEKLAKEQAERERQAEEQRQLEAEKAGQEADRTQARAETQKRREMLQQLLKKAARSVENVWYIEPSEFKGEDLVRLYYNRNSGPLAHSKEIWIHGGHNNWKDGLVIVEKLVSSEKKDGDWWYANGMYKNILFFVHNMVYLSSYG